MLDKTIEYMEHILILFTLVMCLLTIILAWVYDKRDVKKARYCRRLNKDFVIMYIFITVGFMYTQLSNLNKELKSTEVVNKNITD